MEESQQVTLRFLRENPNHIFVFGDNGRRIGKKGAAFFRDEPNAYGFITKKRPSFDNDAYYKPSEYYPVYVHEMMKLMDKIEANPNKTFLISKLGSGLANKYRIFQDVIQKNIKKDLGDFPNVKFLW